MLNLLDFPDEVLCEIFGYLNTFDALYSFLNLNERFNRLLIPFKHQIDLTYVPYNQFMYYINTILPIINKDGTLYGIKLGNKRTPAQITLFNQIICDENYREYFNNIDRIILQSPRLDELGEFVNKYLLSLKNLSILSIEIDYIRDEKFPDLTKLVLNSILSISTLVKLYIEIPSGLNLSRLTSAIMFNSLIHLNLNLSSVTDLLILIQRIPNIENLFICIGWWTSGDRTFVKMLDDMRSNQNPYLNNLRKFHLTILSIISFQFEHLEQVLHQILNHQTTSNFTFILRNGINQNDNLMKLIDGKSWENILSRHSALNQFDLFIRMNAYIKIDDEILTLNSFKRKYFQEKNWNFSFVKFTTKNNTIFYSIPYKNKQLFDISINDFNKEMFWNFPLNYASILSIEYQSNEIPLDFILKQFPYIKELILSNVNINSSAIISMNIPSLHTLKTGNIKNLYLNNLLQSLPLINRLIISYSSFWNPKPSLKYYQYNRIIDLSLVDISELNTDDILGILKQFPNLQYLHIHIKNRRMTEDHLLRSLNNIIDKFPWIVCLKLQLDVPIETLIDWNNQLNGRVKMSFTDIIFEGVLIHLWF